MSIPDNAERPERKKSRRKDSPVTSTDVLAFVIPFLRFAQIQVVGVLSGADILLLVAFLCLVVGRKIKIRTPVEKRVLILCLLWLASQVLTDIVRHTPFDDYARGWSNIAFTFANLVVLFALLYGNRRRLVFYAAGLSLGTILTVWISPNDDMLVDPWKFGFSFAASWAALAIASKEKYRYGLSIVLIALVGMVNFVLNSRSIAGICLTTSFYLLLVRIAHKKGIDSSHLGVKTVLGVGASLVIIASALVFIYGKAAEAGVMGEFAKEKYEAQSAGRFGVLLGGRIELLGSLPAIYDSPILGHGSWAKDPVYLIIERQALAVLGYPRREYEDAYQAKEERFLIPGHSHILGAWVYAGFCGALFWIYIYVIAIRTVLKLHFPKAILVPLTAFAVFSMFWNLLFSPYGAQERIVDTYYIVLMATCLDSASGTLTHAVIVSRRLLSRKKVLSVRPAPGAMPPRVAG